MSAPCTDCLAARESRGAYRVYNPLCLYCGARILQMMPKVCSTNAETTQRRRAMLKVWVDLDHDEIELRELAKQKSIAFEPVTKRAKVEEKAAA
jgi:hypothetical protein